MERAINLHDVTEKITTDKSGANTAAIESVKADAYVVSADASMQILRQHHRAEPSSHQTNRAADTRIQVVLECTHHHRRHRKHAYDPQGADGRHRRKNHVCRQPVLKPCSLITNSAIQLFWPDATITTESTLRLYINFSPHLRQLKIGNGRKTGRVDDHLRYEVNSQKLVSRCI